MGFLEDLGDIAKGVGSVFVPGLGNYFGTEDLGDIAKGVGSVFVPGLGNYFGTKEQSEAIKRASEGEQARLEQQLAFQREQAREQRRQFNTLVNIQQNRYTDRGPFRHQAYRVTSKLENLLRPSPQESVSKRFKLLANEGLDILQRKQAARGVVTGGGSALERARLLSDLLAQEEARMEKANLARQTNLLNLASLSQSAGYGGRFTPISTTSIPSVGQSSLADLQLAQGKVWGDFYSSLGALPSQAVGTAADIFALML